MTLVYIGSIISTVNVNLCISLPSLVPCLHNLKVSQSLQGPAFVPSLLRYIILYALICYILIYIYIYLDILYTYLCKHARSICLQHRHQRGCQHFSCTLTQSARAQRQSNHWMAKLGTINSALLLGRGQRGIFEYFWNNYQNSPKKNFVRHHFAGTIPKQPSEVVKRKWNMESAKNDLNHTLTSLKHTSSDCLQLQKCFMIFWPDRLISSSHWILHLAAKSLKSCWRPKTPRET